MSTPPRRQFDAPPIGNQRATKSGAASNGRNLPTFEQVRADVAAIVDECSWLAAPDGLMLEVFCQELATYRYCAVALQRLSPTVLNKKLNAQKLQVRRARVLGEIADRLGLTPQARYRLGLTAAMAERQLIRVKPERSNERAQQIARILAEAHALPSPSAAESVEPGEVPSVDETPDLRVVDEGAGE